MNIKHVILSYCLILPSFFYGMRVYTFVTLSALAIAVIILSDEPKSWSNLKWHIFTYMVFSTLFFITKL